MFGDPRCRGVLTGEQANRESRSRRSIHCRCCVEKVPWFGFLSLFFFLNIKDQIFFFQLGHPYGAKCTMTGRGAGHADGGGGRKGRKGLSLGLLGIASNRATNKVSFLHSCFSCVSFRVVLLPRVCAFYIRMLACLFVCDVHTQVCFLYTL